MNIIDVFKSFKYETWIFHILEKDQLEMCAANASSIKCSCGQDFCEHIICIQSFGLGQTIVSEDWSAEKFSFYEDFWNSLFTEIMFLDHQERRECLVCFDKIEDEEIVVRCVASCKNMFHQKCLNKWISKKNSCPACRTAFQDIPFY